MSNVESGNFRRRANTVTHKNGSVAKLLTEALSSSSLANLRMPIGFDNLNNAEVIVKTKFYEKPKIIELMTIEKAKENEKLKEKIMLKEKKVFEGRDNLADDLEESRKKG